MMRIMNTFGALIVRFEIGLLQRRKKTTTHTQNARMYEDEDGKKHSGNINRKQYIKNRWLMAEVRVFPKLYYRE